MKRGNQAKSPIVPTSEWLLVLLISLVGLGYLLSRLIKTWGEWPEDGVTAVLRIVELVAVGAFVLLALTKVLWPKKADFTKVDQVGDAGDRGASQ
jgi:hypothetical protein